MNLLSRLRAWLRPYPDDAEMQREVVRTTRAHQAWIAMQSTVRTLDGAHARYGSVAHYADIFQRLSQRLNQTMLRVEDFK